MLFTVAALASVAFGASSSPRGTLRPWVGTMGLYLVYGVVLGLRMGVGWGVVSALS